MINVRRLAVVGEMAMGASYQRYRLSSLTALHHHHVRAASVSTTTRPWRGTTLPGHSAFGGNDAVRLLSTKSTAAQPVKRKPGRPSKKALEERARLELERQQNEEMARIQQEQEQLALAEQERLKMEEEELRVQEEVRQMLLLEEEAARAVAEEEGISPAPDAIAPPEYDAATEQMIQETGLLPLTEEQAPILEAVKTGKNVFFTGPAGSGKSLILKHITHFLQEQGKQLSVTAPTGVAAILVGGETIHSWANMHSGDKPIYDYLDRSKTVLRRIDKKMMKELRGEKTTKPTKLEKKYLAMKHAEVLLIDEISMVSQDMFDRLDVILRCVKKKPGLLFGGIQLVVCGDFYQLPPVVGREGKTCFKCGVKMDTNQVETTTYEEIKHLHDKPLAAREKEYLAKVGIHDQAWSICNYKQIQPCNHVWNLTSRYCFQSRAWLRADFQSIQLKTVHRQSDQTFINTLSRLKQGKITEEDSMYLDSLRRPLPEVDGIRPTRLYTVRAFVDDENKKEYDKLSGEEHVYHAIDFGAHVLQGPAVDAEAVESSPEMVAAAELPVQTGAKKGKSKAAKSAKAAKPKKQQTSVRLLQVMKKGEREDHLFYQDARATSEVRLKVGTQVMLLANLDPSLGLANGSRGVVEGFALINRDLAKKHVPRIPANQYYSIENFLDELFPRKSSKVTVPVVRFSNGVVSGIYPKPFSQSRLQPQGHLEELHRFQIPLAWAWATTIHKSQGQTLDCAIVNLDRIFEAGQAYVGLSRAASPDGLQLVVQEDPMTGKVDWKSKFWVDDAVVNFHDYLADPNALPVRSKEGEASPVGVGGKRIVLSKSRYSGNAYGGGSAGVWRYQSGSSSRGVAVQQDRPPPPPGGSDEIPGMDGGVDWDELFERYEQGNG